MNLTNEKKHFINCAANISRSVDTQSFLNSKFHDGDSYFEDRVDYTKEGIMEYNFQNSVELEIYLQKLWEKDEDEFMRQFINIVKVAAFKSKPIRDSTSAESDDTDEGSNLPNFIYNF